MEWCVVFSNSTKYSYIGDPIKKFKINYGVIFCYLYIIAKSHDNHPHLKLCLKFISIRIGTRYAVFHISTYNPFCFQPINIFLCIGFWRLSKIIYYEIMFLLSIQISKFCDSPEKEKSENPLQCPLWLRGWLNNSISHEAMSNE